ncbi:MAG TPA: diguanylate cyclase [Candidatus Limnocylindrales bacterium]|nr:diguanylate cyclase [Candidatus Limnocylindrales bacterium]
MSTTHSFLSSPAGDAGIAAGPTGVVAPPFAPIEALVGGAAHSRAAAFASHRRRGLRRLVRHDPLVGLSIAIALSVLVMLALDEPRTIWPTIGVTAAFLALELILARAPVDWAVVLPLRFGLVFAYVPLAGHTIDPSGGWPVNSLMIPTVALAAALWSSGLRFVFGVIAILLAIALLPDGASLDLSRRLVALSMAAGVTAIGSRRVVESLQRSRDRLRRAQLLQRRRSRQLMAVEAVGTILAQEGPTPEALDSVAGLLVGTFGYEFPSIYIWDGQGLVLGAQRNYAAPIQAFPTELGVIGRVARTHEPAFLPDVTTDPDYVSADNGVASEISLPLLARDELLGVLNVETAGPNRLDQDDLATLKIVADRLSVALALGRERQALTERARLMDALVAFSRGLGRSLDPDAVHQQVAAGASIVIPASRVYLVLRERDGEAYRIVDMAGSPNAMLGVEVAPGDGLTGRAIVERQVLVEDRLERSRFATAVAQASTAQALSVMSAPLIADDAVMGALTWAREDLRPFSDQEREVAGLLAGQVALAVANADLHHATELAAVTDGLTGLNNRRYFDAAMATAEAARKRVPEADRRPLAAIMFDLDHFGKINKLHGHQVGDRILQTFADVLRTRLRASDLVARYGGEEFVVVLDGTTRIDAMRLAEQIRETFSGVAFGLPDGAGLSCTVSAGCSALLPSEIKGSLVMERADVGLAMAKASGRNRVVAA